MPLRRILALCAATALAGTLGACGNKEDHTHSADTEGVYIDAGPITYQVQLSRQLNPFNEEDAGYLRGVPATYPQPGKQEEWFGIWMRALNQTGRQQTTASPAEFDITDTQGNVYHPVPLDPKRNTIAYAARRLRPLGVEPVADTLGSTDPEQGNELLFKINISAYSNRPLTLEITNAEHRVLGTVSLDL